MMGFIKIMGIIDDTNMQAHKLKKHLKVKRCEPFFCDIMIVIDLFTECLKPQNSFWRREQ